MAQKKHPHLLLAADENNDWRSGSIDHRFKLRESLSKKLTQLFPKENFENILVLEKLPVFNHGFISISHCPAIGAYVIGNRQLGIDIEVESRVRPDIVERVCKKSELSFTKNFTALWSAKESLFKAHRSLKLISDAQILEWKLAQDEIFTFADLHFEGWVYLTQGLTVALTVKKSST